MYEPARMMAVGSAERVLLLALGCACAGVTAAPMAVPAWPPPPGVVIDASPEPETSFVGSPSLAVLADGTYVASHDFFGSKARLLARTRIFASHNRGETWRFEAELPGQFWSSLFVHDGALYLFGTTGEYGNIVIRRSRDGGVTWTTPADASSGVLFPGRFHCAPTPVVAHGGRIWRAFEHYTGDGTWSGRFFNSFAISIADRADLLVAANWSRTNEIPFEGAWLNGDHPGWLEGNVVVAPVGGLVNILRVHAPPTLNDSFAFQGPAAGIPRYEVAAMIALSSDGRWARFDPKDGFIHFPGASSKFTIRFDPSSGRYWSLVDKITNPHSGYLMDYSPYHQRNVVMLTSSPDLRQWDERYALLRWREGLPVYRKDRVGFQYADWQFDGDDLIAVVRTSWNGDTYHNANYLTFHRLAHFRSLQPADSPPPLRAPEPAAREGVSP